MFFFDNYSYFTILKILILTVKDKALSALSKSGSVEVDDVVRGSAIMRAA